MFDLEYAVAKMAVAQQADTRSAVACARLAQQAREQQAATPAARRRQSLAAWGGRLVRLVRPRALAAARR